MKDKLYEQLSALVDDELTGPEQALLARRIGRDADLHRRLSRYQLVSDALQNHLPSQVDPGFYRRVQAALHDEPALRSGGFGGSRFGALVKPLAGLAIAASVAVVAVLSIQSARQEEAPVPALARVPATQDFVRVQQASGPRVQPRVGKKLDIYMVNHNEYAVSRGMQGMLPYVRIVGNEVSRDGRE
ncbi:MAG: sigma-E factor negative regulatory protein [Gammaproteobacteria bacterium]|nr:sigma-E factor negative regulatory protein [Gammaproteobacteria bacterium]MDH3561337.1 sigma-E factor negative regulatory protein [Gammaproteobacteria bacterium]